MAEDPSWGDNHRALLQSLIAHGTLTLSSARPILARILNTTHREQLQPSQITPADFNAYMDKLSGAVAPFDYEIRHAVHQVTGEEVYAFINASSDGLTQAATWCSADEMAFVKRVIDGMFTGANNCRRREVCGITGTGALQLCKVRDSQGMTQGNGEGGTQGGGALGHLTMGNAEHVLRSFVEQGWFEYSEAGYYSLSPRALMELRGWLIETYNEQDSDDEEAEGVSGDRIKMCEACKGIVTVGERCGDKDCPIRLHEGCTEKFFRVKQSTSCPKCKKNWDDHGWVGEKAVIGTGGGGGPANGATGTGRRHTGQTQRPAPRRSRNTQVQEDHEDDED